MLVSHFHWDREWYRTFEAYRARLVDAVDRVLDLLATDPGFHFLLDGQTRAARGLSRGSPRAARRARRAASRRAAGGRTVVRAARLAAALGRSARPQSAARPRAPRRRFGPVSRIGYVPDSFGHPAQLPQLFAGFGITAFVHWRGSGDEIDRIGTAYRWVAPDGSAVAATLLREGYFNAACLPRGRARRPRVALADVVARREDADTPVLLLNGFDHMPPDGHAGAVAEALARLTGTPVERGLLDHVVASPAATFRSVRGDLAGARLANLLPGVWSTRDDDQAREPALRDPARGLGGAVGRARASPRRSRRASRPAARLATTAARARRTTRSAAARLDAVAGDVAATARRGARARPRDGGAAARPARRARRPSAARRGRSSRRSRSSTRHRTSAPTWCACRSIPTLRCGCRSACRSSRRWPLAAAEGMGFEIDGRPARVVQSNDPARPRWLPDQEPLDLELVAADVPAFGCRRLRLGSAQPAAHQIDEGREIDCRGVHVHVADDGTPRRAPGRRGVSRPPRDRGPGRPGRHLRFRSRRSRSGHPSRLGVAAAMAASRRASPGLEIARTFMLPRGLDQSRTRRRTERALLTLWCEARVAPGVPRVDLTVRVDNTGGRSSPATPLPDRPAGDGVPCRHDVRRRGTHDGTTRRRRLDARRARHLRPPGLGECERADGRRARAPGGGGDGRRHHRHHPAPCRRLARALRPTEQAGAGWPGHADPGRTDARSARSPAVVARGRRSGGRPRRRAALLGIARRSGAAARPRGVTPGGGALVSRAVRAQARRGRATASWSGC